MWPLTGGKQPEPLRQVVWNSLEERGAISDPEAGTQEEELNVTVFPS